MRLNELQEIIDDLVLERLIKKIVIRKNKKRIKWVTDKDGFKVQMDGSTPREVKMKPDEIRRRKKGAKKGAKKAKAKANVAAAKRARSLKKSKNL